MMIKKTCHLRALRRCGFSVALAAGLGLALTAGSAGAACNLVLSSARVQMGKVSASTLRVASVPGYRSMGTKSALVRGTCDVPQASFRIEFSGLAPIVGQPLVRWGEAGAIQMRVAGASVGGVPVNVKLESAPASAYAPALDLTRNDVLVLDVSQVPAQDRKSLSIQLQVNGMLPENYIVRSEVVLDSNVAVQLLSAP